MPPPPKEQKENLIYLIYNIQKKKGNTPNAATLESHLGEAVAAIYLISKAFKFQVFLFTHL
jgi:hypothetical protein